MSAKLTAKLTTNSVNLGYGDSSVILVSIRECNSQIWMPASTMMNSAVSTQFIDFEFAYQLGLKLDLKLVLEALIVVDG